MKNQGIQVSMDGKGRATQCLYRKALAYSRKGVCESLSLRKWLGLEKGLDRFFRRFNLGLAEKVSGMPDSKRANEDVCLYFE
ncbi:hypothetical protein [Arthrospiribacter ruber]|uniref:hypothetical protein n=1 Tax=Arthrospiribacter ruber TaxID=2487934 RepID=UPI001C5A8C67|nr:hypothetical protein [Arthrospiribacter ruber]